MNTRPAESTNTSVASLLATVTQGGEPSARRFQELCVLVDSHEHRPLRPIADAVRDCVRTQPKAFLPELVLLLGLVCEKATPTEEVDVHAAVAAGMDTYLSLLRSTAFDEPLGLALLYLLAHFPEHRDRILAELNGRSLGTADRARLERCLSEVDLANPVLGRVWPSPAGWDLTEGERDTDREWARGLSATAIRDFWTKDTNALLAYSGAKARAATLGCRVPGEETELLVPPKPIDIDDAAPPSQPAATLRCDSCHGVLRTATDAYQCDSCRREYPVRSGVLDMVDGITGADVIGVNAPRYLPRYEGLLRPAFLRVHGYNWDARVSVADEDRYLADHVRADAGVVLDAAAGAGRWTSLLAREFGSENVIAVDLAPTMLRQLAAQFPTILPVLASATDLPFHDGGVGAINCWNALQAMAEPWAALTEFGRCLAPGGTLTILTFRPARDPLYRHFQRRIESAFGVHSFDPSALRGGLARAGLTVVDEYTPGLFLITTARRDA